MVTHFVFLSAALPWLNPFSFGPTSAVGPYLFSWFCLSLLIGVIGARTVRLKGDKLMSAAAFGLLQYFGATAPFGVWVNATQLGEAFVGVINSRFPAATTTCASQFDLVPILLAG